MRTHAIAKQTLASTYQPSPLATTVEYRRNCLVAGAFAVAQNEPDGVHTIRVSARRLRTLVRIAQHLADGPALLDDVSARLYWLGAQLAPARDAAVQGELLRSELDQLPAGLQDPAVRAALGKLCADRAEFGRTLAEHALHASGYRALRHTLDALVITLYDSEIRTADLRKVTRLEIARQLRKAQRHIERVRSGKVFGDALPRELHSARSALKKVRYAAELLEPMEIAQFRKTMSALTPLLDSLGNYNDYHLMEQTCRDLRDRAQVSGTPSATLNAMASRSQQRMAMLVDEVCAKWPAVRRQVRRLVREAA